ncbi:MAG: hypothetical protein AABY00_04085 [Nanoarchaeota archaeon]
MDNKKLTLKTRIGRDIPAFSIEEAVAQDFIHAQEGDSDIEDVSSDKYTHLTTVYSLPEEERIFIAACEQLNQKPYIVIYQQNARIAKAAIFIPKQTTKKRIF